jgi:quinol monooxygenase YgiN
VGRACCGARLNLRIGSWRAIRRLELFELERISNMIFIVVKFPVRPERSDEWLSLVEDFTKATRAEPGNLFFEWSRSVEDPNEFVLVEGFADGAAGAAHVGSEHFKTAMAVLPDAISARPKIISHELPGDGWGPMGELAPR